MVRGPLILAAALASLVVACGAALWSEARTGPERRRAAEAFQTRLGGLGFGPATEMESCPFTFDPRVCPDYPQDLGPVPGGVYFSPCQGCSVLYYPPLKPTAPGDEEGSNVALP